MIRTAEVFKSDTGQFFVKLDGLTLNSEITRVVNPVMGGDIVTIIIPSIIENNCEYNLDSKRLVIHITKDIGINNFIDQDIKISKPLYLFIGYKPKVDIRTCFLFTELYGMKRFGVIGYNPEPSSLLINLINKFGTTKDFIDYYQ